jgi:hypothetical protein
MMRRECEKDRKTSIIQAAVLGRVERLAGSGLEASPFPHESDLGRAFVEWWSRSLDNPIMRMIQQGKKSLRDMAETARDSYA